MGREGLSHLSNDGTPRMVDVGDKAVTARSAIAVCEVRLPPALEELFRDGEVRTKKGPVFHTAIIAGTMAAKRTSDLIPFCHPLPIEDCSLSISMADPRTVRIECSVKVHHRTGVEMEALTGASVAALTVYDMCKSVSHDIVIGDLRLIRKEGGKSDVHA
jgi:cyclic pyranopterin monophosphate synthase